MKELLKIQSELKVPKNQYNKFGNYNYRSCEDIIEVVKPLCHAAGCILTLSDEIVQIGNRYYVKAVATLRNSEETFQTVAYAREEDVKKGMDSSQITGAASSYARKYALNGLFAIDDIKDADHYEKKLEQKTERKKPVLNKAMEKWDDAINYIKGGGSIETVIEKYDIDVISIEELKTYSK